MSTTTLDRTTRFGMVAMQTGRSYDIAVCRPLESAVNGTVETECPIVVLLDSSLTFGTAVERTTFYSAMGALRSAVLVGIGYLQGIVESSITRTFDYTPATPPGTHAELAPITGTDFGGADDFLDFILDQLVPRIREMAPEASNSRVILHGFSLAGMFAAYALLKKPNAFEAVSMISPSLWWNDFAVLEGLPAFAQQVASAGRCPRILVGVGALEQPAEDDAALADLSEEMRALGQAARMVDAAESFANALKDHGATDLQFVTFNQEDHTGAVTAGTGRAMGFALKL